MSNRITPVGPAAEHEAVLQALRAVTQKITPKQAANAFLYSLSTRALEYRAVLGSYWYAVTIPDHTPTDSWHCYDCGWYSKDRISIFGRDPNKLKTELEKLMPLENSLLREALKFSLEAVTLNNSGRPNYGFVHTDPQQCLLVLQHYLTLQPVQHTDQDEELLRKILQCVYLIEPHQRGRALQKKISQSKIIRSNAWEIDNLLNALGICGVLSSSRAPCYAEEFCNEYQRSPETDTDLLYPLNWWRACDGINQVRYQIVFGKPYSGPVSIVTET